MKTREEENIRKSDKIERGEENKRDEEVGIQRLDLIYKDEDHIQ